MSRVRKKAVENRAGPPGPPVRILELQPRGLTKAQAARYIGGTSQAIENLVADGRLRQIKYPGVRRYFYDRAALDLVIEQSQCSTVPATVPAKGSKYGLFEASRGLKR